MPTLPKIKICGLKTKEEINIINQFNVSYAGFIFAESKRKVTKEQVLKLKEELKPDVLTVGVFMNQDIDFVNEVIEYCNLDYVQLHGDESLEYCENIIGADVIKNIGIENKESLDKIDLYKNDFMVLLDTKIGKVSGGTGVSFDWSMIENQDFPKGYILAGGINPGNIVEALKYNSDVIDVNSGVETNLIKDYKKITELFNNMEDYDD